MWSLTAPHKPFSLLRISPSASPEHKGLEDRVLLLYTTVSLVPITTVCSVILAGQELERGHNAKDLPALAEDCLTPAPVFHCF